MLNIHKSAIRINQTIRNKHGCLKLITGVPRRSRSYLLCFHRARVLRRFFQILRSERNPQSERQSHEGGDIVLFGRAFYSSDEEGPEQRRR
jgi:hypothetical protein